MDILWNYTMDTMLDHGFGNWKYCVLGQNNYFCHCLLSAFGQNGYRSQQSGSL